MLIRHAAPRVDLRVPAAEWRLSSAGREQCTKLAGRLLRFGLHRIVTSTEPKAVETGALAAAHLNVPVGMADGLHEHERETTPPFSCREAFAAAVVDALQRPAELVLGEETANVAHERFASALRAVLRRYPTERLGVVGHGTVIALLIARANRLDPAALWRRLGLPSFAAVVPPTYELLEMVEEVS